MTCILTLPIIRRDLEGVADQFSEVGELPTTTITTGELATTTTTTGELATTTTTITTGELPTTNTTL